jgi:hypothetical protein
MAEEQGLGLLMSMTWPKKSSPLSPSKRESGLKALQRGTGKKENWIFFEASNF